MQIWEIVKEIYKSNPNKKSPKEIADLFNISVSQVYRYSEPSDGSGTTLPSNLIVPLTIFTGDDRLIRHIVNQCDYNLIKIPSNGRKSAKDVLKELNKVIKEFSDLVGESSKSMLDNKITKQEAKKIEKEADELIEQVAFYKEVIKNE